MKTILIGFGDIAEKHLDVLKELNCDVIGILTKNYDKALIKSKKFSIPNTYTSIQEILNAECDFFMNLTSADKISSTIMDLIPAGKPIFTEKPAGFSTEEIEQLIVQNNKFNCPIMVGTNRRFYSIFHKAIEFLSDKNKSINTIKIDAPERFVNIKNPKFNDRIRKNWMFANSIHSVDLIRFFGGDVKKIKSDSIPNESKFQATGICENGVKFSYSSNWNESKKWNITILADDIKIVFEPLEKGKIITNDHEVEIIPSIEDVRFKPGFFSQLSYFLENVVTKNNTPWPGSNLEDHKKSIRLVEDIFKK